ncbi:nitrate- and nitrite sensing domain-containing protein [Streptomyces sp. NEAU-H22]|uniref:sensor histidine kinase n=1 Tax=unclassified Streptomyces TaxID=2593676 RepID=UPI0022557478|nr:MULTISPECIES: nitrate- and nitrite sensing domain-containing protein [unclassified Streptomyces]MCX3290455.1 nitrate- and nitrite sensing domain-containing protein [Streptomyces sp. NEAU-H22]WMD04869.1 nitrate- and nitrite sensing domain-containing protein [Streptomyces sp. FXY-T5]
MSRRTGARRRLGSIRLSLVLLALVPSVTLAAMWGVTTIQMFSEGLRLRDQTDLSRSTGAMGTDATLALQRERSLSAAWLATPKGSRAALDAQRAETDKAVAKLVGQADAIEKAPSRISDRLYSVLGSVGSLEYYRDQVDDPTDITAQQALDQYSSIIDDQIHAFQELSQVDDGDLTSQAGPLVGLEHAAELVSREDAQLTLAWPTGHLDDKTWTQFTELVNTRRWLVQDQVLPQLTGDAKAQTERILASREWQTLQSVEDQVLASRNTSPTADRIALPDARKRWSAAMDQLSDRYAGLIEQQTAGLLERSAEKADALLLKAALLSTGGLLALLVCVGMSWRITRSLSRRLRGLRRAAVSLAQERLPDVVARLDRGETVDPESATTELDYGHDELGQVARAFNTAQRTAVHTAVELADTRRGFQKIILGIARQSQNLVNLQLSKLDTLEREHTDPDILKGLYELDSTASQLRRYEENLVIVSGERPGRSWTEPVALMDILRSAVGEVAEYQRVEVLTEEEVYVAPPAVADVIHLLAELIDNATAYSPAPSPVTVRAGMVAKGLAVEVEDRGLGMSEEDYASFNEQLAVSPQFDVVALAGDLRLGMFVIGRLAHRHGIAVTLRSSPYGGTTAIVLIPHEIVVRETTGGGTTDGDIPEDGLMAVDGRGARDAGPGEAPPRADVPEKSEGGTERAVGSVRETRPLVTARTASAAPSTTREVIPRRDGLAPLPRRVPQTSLVEELREESAPAEPDGFLDDFTAEAAASSLAGFQRGTLRARDDDAEPPHDEEVAAAPRQEPAAPVPSTPPADR